MERASTFFSDQERSQIAAAVAEAEKTTAGEIVPVVATASGDYDRAEDVVGLWVAALALAGFWWFSLPAAETGDWVAREIVVSWKGLLAAIGVVVAGFILGAAVATQIGWLRRLFTSRRLMRNEVERAAYRAFFEHGLRDTQERTGILIYLSLFERMVTVSGDQAIAEKLSDRDWAEVRDLILKGIKEGNPGNGMVAGVERCGQILTEHFPIQPGDANELSNDLRIID
ncbi:MAG: TPM domain-containing protein [Deltaproteobacteria bacterium]|nr:TPM domain-containing protein [Deltaproteobacteria bacterium]MBW1871681.1 TPM domain-containing protein [Deltaproteobacteria bacterium]